MKEYKFTLQYRVPVIDDLDEYVDVLEDAGCHDALIGIEESGLIVLMFERSASSASAAISSARDTIENAIPNGVFVEAGPDYCGISDIATHIGVSRQYVRKIWMNHESLGFPDPVSRGKSPTWNLAIVLNWMIENSKLKEDFNDLCDLAKESMRLNLDSSLERLNSVCGGKGGQQFEAIESGLGDSLFHFNEGLKAGISGCALLAVEPSDDSSTYELQLTNFPVPAEPISLLEKYEEIQYH